MGGREKLELIQASILEGKVQAMKQEIPIKFTSIKEKGYRMDMEIMGMKLWTIATPDGATWAFDAFVKSFKEAEATVDGVRGFSASLRISGEPTYTPAGPSV